MGRHQMCEVQQWIVRPPLKVWVKAAVRSVLRHPGEPDRLRRPWTRRRCPVPALARPASSLSGSQEDKLNVFAKYFSPFATRFISRTANCVSRQRIYFAVVNCGQRNISMRVIGKTRNNPYKFQMPCEFCILLGFCVPCF